MDNLKPQRAYPDWHRQVPPEFQHEIYNSNDDWVYYLKQDWESYLFYTVIMHNKDYILQGSMPDWLKRYLENGEIVPFETQGDIVLVFEKADWVRNTLTFYLEDRVAPDGFVYNCTSKVEPSEAFLSGAPAPGRASVPQSVWEPYAIKRKERQSEGIVRSRKR